MSSEILDVLRLVQKELDANRMEWVLVGSLSLYLQGVPVVPHDIDIMTTKSGAYKCQELFKKHVMQPVEWGRTAEFESYFGKFRIGNVLVEVMGELKVFESGNWISLAKRLNNPRRIVVRDFDVPVSSLEEQAAAYKRSSREKDRQRALLIENTLRRGTS
ncbi:MAG: hypothetical protein Q6373_003555 [Candidatus Sigynarchaeota archaeon]